MKLIVGGDVAVPGDKSITHRALMLAGAAKGISRLSGLLPGGDCRSTAAVLRALGVTVPELPSDGSEITVSSPGIGSWQQPADVLDCGNSGTTARLMMGLLAGRSLRATLTGDESLRSRPMRRITEPLSRMGASFREIESPDRLPIEIQGGPLTSIEYHSPKASAQIKSAVLLAGLSADVPVSVQEPVLSRDHSERMLRSMGVRVQGEAHGGGWRVSLEPTGSALPALDLRVPGDPSSAAFLVALALLADSGELRIHGVATNPTRAGFFDAVRRMGGAVRIEQEEERSGEPVGTVVAAASKLHGCEIGGAEIPSLIDEVPMLAVLAACASGETRITGAEELRAKESDRIAMLVQNLRAIGASAEELPDGLIVQGTTAPLSGTIHTAHDHRIAMAFAILGMRPGNHVEVDDPAVVDVSFPGFWEMLASVSGAGPAPRRVRE